MQADVGSASIPSQSPSIPGSSQAGQSPRDASRRSSSNGSLALRFQRLFKRRPGSSNQDNGQQLHGATGSQVSADHSNAHPPSVNRPSASAQAGAAAMSRVAAQFGPDMAGPSSSAASSSHPAIDISSLSASSRSSRAPSANGDSTILFTGSHHLDRSHSGTCAMSHPDAGLASSSLPTMTHHLQPTGLPAGQNLQHQPHRWPSGPQNHAHASGSVSGVSGVLSGRLPIHSASQPQSADPATAAPPPASAAAATSGGSVDRQTSLQHSRERMGSWSGRVVSGGEMQRAASATDGTRSLRSSQSGFKRSLERLLRTAHTRGERHAGPACLTLACAQAQALNSRCSIFADALNCPKCIH